jgi:hypothetical protein
MRRFVGPDLLPEPARFLADPTANFRSVLANARGANEGIKPTQSGGQRTGAVDEQVDSLGCMRLSLANKVFMSPETPSRPDDWYKRSLMGAAVMPFSPTTPGSRLPQRRLMTNPSSAIVVATLLRCFMAHMLAPLPRWATTTRPSAPVEPRISGRSLAMYS